MPVQLSGRLQDITTQPVEEVTTATVKAPVYTISSSGITTSQPRVLRIEPDGSFTVTTDSGVGYLYLSGNGWTDSIKFVAADGMTTFLDAVINALPVASAVRDMLQEIISTGETTIEEIKALLANSVDQMARGSGERYLTSSDHLDNEKPGTAQVHAGIAAAVGAPDGHMGTVFTSWTSDEGRGRIQWYIGRDINGQYHVRYRYYGTNGWTAWQYDFHPEQFVDERARLIEHGTDWNTLTEGEWRKRTSPPTPDPNSPVNVGGLTPVGVLRVMNPGYSDTGAIIQMFYAYSGQGVFYRSANTQGVFKPWVRIDTPAVQGFELAVRREMMVDAMTARHGGVLGTGGKPAIALRFDHHLIPFRDKILPLLVERDLPWTQVINPENMGTNNDAVPWTDLQDWALKHGGEVWNHGGNHADATGDAAIYQQVVGSLQSLQMNLPRLAVENWAPPGLPAGGYDGHAPMQTIAQWADTYAGRIIVGHHAAVAGYVPGQGRVLDGRLRIGLSHATVDNAQMYHFVNHLDSIEPGTGMAFMVHPNVLDTTSKVTTETLRRFLDDVVARRDRGEIEVLTYSGLAMADAGSNFRHDLLDTHESTGDFAETVDMSRTPWLLGGVRELVADVTAAGTVTVAVGEATKTYAVNGTQTIRMVATIPLDSGNIPVTITGATSTANVKLRGI